MILLLAPMRIELNAVVRAFRLVRDGDVHGGRLPDGTAVTAAMIGVGPAVSGATTERLLAAHGDVERVVVVGVAGGIDERFGIGDVIVPEMVVDAASGRSFTVSAGATGALRASGRMITSGQMLTGADNLARLRGEGYAAIDMETSAVAAVCEARAVPWCAIRSVSDTLADELADDDTLSLLRPDGTTDPRAVVRLLRRRPLAVRTLARLGRDTKRATSAAAAAAMLACRPA